MRFCQLRYVVLLIGSYLLMLNGRALAALDHRPTRVHAGGVRIVHSVGVIRQALAFASAERGPLLIGRMLPSSSRNAAIGQRSAVKIPNVPSLPVLDATQNPNFNPLLAPGLNSYLSEKNFPKAYGTLGFAIEPPEPALCVGGGKVVEMVQLVVQIFDTSGNALGPPTDLFSFFGSPNITNLVNGADSIGLARCYYDAPTNTFFFVATDVGNIHGGPHTSALLVALMPVANTSPAAVVTIFTTDDGKTTTIKHKHCPCYEDQPLIGADANAIYVSGNEFALATGAFNGGQIYAINKTELVAMSADPGIVVFEAPNLLPDTAKDLDAAGSIIPAAAPDGIFDTTNNGTEYFLSTIDLANKRDNRIAIWAVTNSCGIPGAGSCGLTPTLTSAVLLSNAYGRPPNARQRKDLIPVGQFCGNPRASKLVTFDDRMQQVVFAAGKLYSAVTTAVNVNKKKQSGLLYFVVTPTVTGGTVNGTISDSNYVAHDGLDLFYPAIAATQTGSAVMTFSFSGVNAFPSAGYIPITPDLGTFEIHTAVAGVGTYDGESGYPGCGGFAEALWGFNAAAVAENNTMWMATEYVSATCNYHEWINDPKCGKTRGNGSNWGTLISNLVPPGGP